MIYSVFANVNTPKQHIRRERKGDFTFEYLKQSLVAFKGKCRVETEYDEFWDRTGKGKAYTSRVMTDPTWKQLFEAAKKSQKATGDYHHDFFEGASVRTAVDGVQIITLHLGS